MKLINHWHTTRRMRFGDGINEKLRDRQYRYCKLEVTGCIRPYTTVVRIMLDFMEVGVTFSSSIHFSG